MSFKVGDRVKTTNNTMGPTHTSYHNVIGTITGIRNGSSLPIMFKPDVNVAGEVPEWALFEDEVVPLQEHDYWKKKYWELRKRVDRFRYDLEGL